MRKQMVLAVLALVLCIASSYYATTGQFRTGLICILAAIVTSVWLYRIQR